MGTLYLYGTILTDGAVASNNHGANLGSTMTLQKVFLNDDLHTSVSAEAIRFAFRYRFQLENEDEVNRTFKVIKNRPVLGYKSKDRSKWPKELFRDDDLMGWMVAKQSKVEKEASAEAEDSGKGAKVRFSPLAVGRAVSLRPYRGELSFNSVSGEKVKKAEGGLSRYNAEMHTTEYQYSFGLNLNDVVDLTNIKCLLDAVIDPPRVAGNHARFAYDFSPASIVLRVTNAHSSKIQSCFEHDEASRGYTVARLVRRVKSKDIPADQLIIGGELTFTPEGADLRKLGVKACDGIGEAANETLKKIAGLDKKFKGLMPKQ